ncbi:hypothetical protein AVEN_223451-1 [Araneus ventricosus]|uniref:Uncharacterized protein n=1 Tax=Araneus ventricosus TaxID=182803 RepID=A0A4Y2ETK8_ARAVE|nr:hypothetical protein AVEN_223451-1 [Araneus ventricosus]
MTRTTPEPASLSPNFCTKPARGRLAHYVAFYVQQAHTHCGSSGKSGFDRGTLHPEADTLSLGHRGRVHGRSAMLTSP